MSLSFGQILTWSDFSKICLDAIYSCCCNIGDSAYASVPSYLRSGTGSVRVGTSQATWKIPDQANNDTRKTYNYAWNAVPTGGLINKVTRNTTTDTVKTEWENFLSSANINAKANTLISAQELTLAVGLFMQFFSYHVQPVDSKREIYNSVSTQTRFQSFKYVTGTITKDYDVKKDEITNADLTSIINKNLNPSRLMKHSSNTQQYSCQIQAGGRL